VQNCRRGRIAECGVIEVLADHSDARCASPIHARAEAAARFSAQRLMKRLRRPSAHTYLLREFNHLCRSRARRDSLDFGGIDPKIAATGQL
jgi:hypothetical protein